MLESTLCEFDSSCWICGAEVQPLPKGSQTYILTRQSSEWTGAGWEPQKKKTKQNKNNCLAWTSGDHVGMWDHLWSDPDFQEEINIQGFVGILPIFKYLNMHKCSKTTAGINKTCLEAGSGLCWLGDDFCPRPCSRKGSPVQHSGSFLCLPPICV